MTGFEFANPWGLAALAAIPVLVAIHFLQRRARPVLISTAFLLPPNRQEAPGGRVFRYFRQSPSFWLQVLAALLLSFVLAQPRFVASESVQQITLVLDATQSMRAFLDETRVAIDRVTGRLEKNAARTEWRLLSSDPRRSPLYSGTNREEMLAALQNWDPTAPTLDPLDVLVPASRRAEGELIFVSDRRPAFLPPGVALLTAGRPIENVGFTGISVDADAGTWRAFVRNDSATAITRKWWMQIGEQGSEPKQIQLGPGETTILEGSFPSEKVTLHLDADAFDLDDQLPLVLPARKPLKVVLPNDAGTFESILASLPSVEIVTAPPSTTESTGILKIATTDAPPPESEFVPVLFSRHSPDLGPGLLGGAVYAESHPLVEGLDWTGLVVAAVKTQALQEKDRVLVWAGENPLIALRPGLQGGTLVFQFDPAQSNAARLPAFVLLLARHLENWRKTLPGSERENFELRQDLAYLLPQAVPFEVRVQGMETEKTRHPAAPGHPGFFEVVSESAGVTLSGASHFADARQARFQDAESIDETAKLESSLHERNPRLDFFSSLWLILALGAVMGSWWFSPGAMTPVPAKP